jgi:hypothetical protein
MRVINYSNDWGMTNSLHGSFPQVSGLFLVQFRQVTLFIQLYCTIIHNSSDKVAKQKNKYKTKNIEETYSLS